MGIYNVNFSETGHEINTWLSDVIARAGHKRGSRTVLSACLYSQVMRHKPKSGERLLVTIWDVSRRVVDVMNYEHLEKGQVL